MLAKGSHHAWLQEMFLCHAIQTPVYDFTHGLNGGCTNHPSIQTCDWNSPAGKSGAARQVECPKVYSALVHLALHRQKASWKHGPMWKAPAVTSLPIFWHKKCLLQAWLLPMLLARASSHSTIHGVEGMEAIAG